jgi:2-C-methyl-D-erythritol 4-phosphate cytidylyltransferase
VHDSLPVRLDIAVVLAIIVAAGRGERLGADRPKALVQLAGQPLVQWSVSALGQVASIGQIVVALPAGVSAPEGTLGVQGGAVRSDSVRRALAVSRPAQIVLVHDAARPLLTPELAQSAISALQGDESLAGVIAAAPVTDTVKQVTSEGVVSATLERKGLWAVQTPQVFRRNALEQALDVSDDVLAMATDDAWLVERAGGKVAVLASDKENLKVTTALDLQLAQMLLDRRTA